MNTSAVDVVADKVRNALASADLERFAELLDPNVTWGAPGDPSPACRNRQQVLAWYARGRAGGRRAQVRSVTTFGDKILVAMTVTSAADSAVADRWQVLSVVGGLITDIRGYDREDEARASADPAT